MSKVTNKEVAANWIKGEPAESGHMNTNGRKLFSYNLLIGETIKGERIVHDYRSGTALGFISKTTSQHVSLAITALENR